MKALQITVFVIGLLAMVEQSCYAHDSIPAFGIIVTSSVANKAFNKSGLFGTPTSSSTISGRTFLSGTIYGSPYVFVYSADTPSINVAITVQIMATNFDLRGIIYYGSAGTTNETLELATVHVPGSLAFTGNWEWLSKDSNEIGQLNIADFNTPANGENLLGSVNFDSSNFYSAGALKNRFYIPVSPYWLEVAARIKEVESKENCIINANCLLHPGYPVVVGLNASSSDTYVKNPAYREFLYKEFRVSTVDTDSVAVALGALSNDLQYLVFHGISNKAGAGDGTGKSSLANKNAVKAVARFIWELTVPRAAR